LASDDEEEPAPPSGVGIDMKLLANLEPPRNGVAPGATSEGFIEESLGFDVDALSVFPVVEETA
jgi:hypothetical protein